jgi:dihydroorotate dehydrogenase electron transfer subunit
LQMKKSVQELEVVSNTRLNSDHHIIRLKSGQKLEMIEPGQFVNIRVDHVQSVFLRRPYSIHAVDYENDTFDILVKGIGEGSKYLLKREPGEILSAIFPLGKGFTIPERNVNKERVLIVAGGCGVAPLYWLAHVLKERADLITLIGGRTFNDLVEIEKYREFGEVYATTEDGTFGEKGYVTDHSLFVNELNHFSRIYACGPDAMMKAVAAKAYEKDIFCEVSLENTMACGFCVCLCCVTDTVDGHKCVCTDGPVFNINTLKWQISV